MWYLNYLSLHNTEIIVEIEHYAFDLRIQWLASYKLLLGLNHIDKKYIEITQLMVRENQNSNPG